MVSATLAGAAEDELLTVGREPGGIQFWAQTLSGGTGSHAGDLFIFELFFLHKHVSS